MKWNIRSLREHFRHMGLAYLILVVSLVPTFLLYFRTKDVEQMLVYVPVFLLLGVDLLGSLNKQARLDVE